jgi:hypothetical protein
MPEPAFLLPGLHCNKKAAPLPGRRFHQNKTQLLVSLEHTTHESRNPEIRTLAPRLDRLFDYLLAAVLARTQSFGWLEYMGAAAWTCRGCTPGLPLCLSFV